MQVLGLFPVSGSRGASAADVLNAAQAVAHRLAAGPRSVIAQIRQPSVRYTNFIVAASLHNEAMTLAPTLADVFGFLDGSLDTLRVIELV